MQLLVTSMYRKGHWARSAESKKQKKLIGCSPIQKKTADVTKGIARISYNKVTLNQTFEMEATIFRKDKMFITSERSERIYIGTLTGFV